MAKNAKKAKVDALSAFIWSQQGKCESICEINRQLINQYCRFCVLSEDVSERIINTPLNEDTSGLTEAYMRYNKIVLQLYKTLKFDQIKDELASFGNPYTALFKEAEKDGDF